MRRIADALNGVARLGIDTSPVIYLIEAHPTYDARVVDIFARIDSGAISGIASVITLLEVLAQPIRHGNLHLQREYRDRLLQSRNLRTVAVDVAIAERAADIRAGYQLRTSDAVQVATAIETGCDALLTNDPALQRVTELSVLVLDDLEL